MPHLHLSLQAGDDLTLKRMKRRHARADSVSFCAEMRRLRPDMVFGADLIAGFPTETEAMFANSLSLVDDCGLTFLHVFPYSRARGDARGAHAASAWRRDLEARRRIAREGRCRAEAPSRKCQGTPHQRADGECTARAFRRLHARPDRGGARSGRADRRRGRGRRRRRAARRRQRHERQPRTSSFFKRLFGAGDETPKPIETPPPPKREPPGKGPDKKEPPQDRPPREEPPERERLPKEASAKPKSTPKPKGPPPAGPHPHPSPDDAGKSGPSPKSAPPPAGPAAAPGATPPEDLPPASARKRSPKPRPWPSQDAAGSISSARALPAPRARCRTISRASITKRKLDDDMLDRLEEVLIKADLGVAMAGAHPSSDRKRPLRPRDRRPKPCARCSPPRSPACWSRLPSRLCARPPQPSRM